ncbi:MAG: hypothetical protein FD174_112 [Geobacteraceae bacterium]|nr:MAG: hypothetical protein FD174_112 [Geobacteraceae bacterium]
MNYPENTLCRVLLVTNLTALMITKQNPAFFAVREREGNMKRSTKGWCRLAASVTSALAWQIASWGTAAGIENQGVLDAMLNDDVWRGWDIIFGVILLAVMLTLKKRFMGNERNGEEG